MSFAQFLNYRLVFLPYTFKMTEQIINMLSAGMRKTRWPLIQLTNSSVEKPSSLRLDLTVIACQGNYALLVSLNFLTVSQGRLD